MNGVAYRDSDPGSSIFFYNLTDSVSKSFYNSTIFHSSSPVERLRNFSIMSSIRRTVENQ
ncbi:hypothetical protein Csa_011979 [Cucumis sativus]|uniref:Uncharacterized protein n=1 Tax=Cucumis sativus TaxID=3659 RepID=A0A0A0L456_CUCSA|nr:hypothetical protein Csa_011979 [Cucumis sativus]